MVSSLSPHLSYITALSYITSPSSLSSPLSSTVSLPLLYIMSLSSLNFSPPSPIPPPLSHITHISLLSYNLLPYIYSSLYHTHTYIYIYLLSPMIHPSLPISHRSQFCLSLSCLNLLPSLSHTHLSRSCLNYHLPLSPTSVSPFSPLIYLSPIPSLTCHLI